MGAEKKKELVIFFAGDSGDGIQLTGGQFSETSGLLGNDLITFPNYPAEIRAPKGSLGGVSGFQLKIGSIKVFTPGDKYDVLVAMNAAALKTSLNDLKEGGIIIANTDGFDKKSLQLAGYESNPLENHSLDAYQVNQIDITKLTRNSVKELGLGAKEADRSKNMFVLGYVYWMYNRPLDFTINFLKEKFKNKPDILEANITVLKTGYNYGDTSEAIASRFEIDPAPMPKGTYRNVKGNQAAAIGLIAAAEKAGLDLFYASYPITPASDILHALSRYKNFGVKTYQAEDEIAAVCAAIGASFGGALAVTASSGPGIALKGEGIGLAVILELPLVIINVQRGGPSTGLPTKTEQSDLFQAMYGRNGEAPAVVIAASSPKDCFNATVEACKIAVEYMTPVFVLSDGYIGNGSEPWMFPTADQLPSIQKHIADPSRLNGGYKAYERNEKLVRDWASPGMAGFQHRIGGLEKEIDTGNVSYDPGNHEIMVNIRIEKVKRIAEDIPPAKVEQGEEKGKILVMGWGSTYGAISTAVTEMIEEGYRVSQLHLRYLNPLPRDLDKVLANFEKVIIPEMNAGQLLPIIRSEFMVPAIGLNKIKGLPFTVDEIKARIKFELGHEL